MNRIEEKYGIKKSNAIGLFICMLLIVLQVYCLIAQLITTTGVKTTITSIIQLVLIIGFAYYALIGYKKPHGNILKYLMLFYAAFSGFLMVYQESGFPLYFNLIGMAKILAIAYVSGRLDRINQNKIILGIIVVFDAIFDIYLLNLYIKFGLVSFAYVANCFSSLSFSLTLVLAYITRFKLHKEAGLEDK